MDDCGPRTALRPSQNIGECLPPPDLWEVFLGVMMHESSWPSGSQSATSVAALLSAGSRSHVWSLKAGPSIRTPVQVSCMGGRDPTA